jgi:hypothetical protein
MEPKSGNERGVRGTFEQDITINIYFFFLAVSYV